MKGIFQESSILFLSLITILSVGCATPGPAKYTPAEKGMACVRDNPPEVVLEKPWTKALPYAACVGFVVDQSVSGQLLEIDGTNMRQALVNALKQHELFPRIETPHEGAGKSFEAQLAYAESKGCDLLILPELMERNIEFLETDEGSVVGAIILTCATFGGALPGGLAIAHDHFSGNLKVYYSVYSVQTREKIYE